MSTTSYTITGSTYVEISSSGTALVTNECSDPVRLVFAVSLPAADTEDYLTLRTETYGISQVSGVPAGNIYVRSDVEGSVCKVTVS